MAFREGQGQVQCLWIPSHVSSQWAVLPVMPLPSSHFLCSGEMRLKTEHLLYGSRPLFPATNSYNFMIVYFPDLGTDISFSGIIFFNMLLYSSSSKSNCHTRTGVWFIAHVYPPLFSSRHNHLKTGHNEGSQ